MFSLEIFHRLSPTWCDQTQINYRHKDQLVKMLSDLTLPDLLAQFEIKLPALVYNLFVCSLPLDTSGPGYS